MSKPKSACSDQLRMDMEVLNLAANMTLDRLLGDKILEYLSLIFSGMW